MLKQKQGEIGLGVILTVAVAVIVALVLFQQIAGNTDVPTKTASLSQGLYTAPSAGSCIDLVGQELLSTPTVTNRSDGATIPAVNYTISEGVSSVDGLKRIRFCTVGTLQDPYSTSINVSYTYGREGYIEDNGARSIAGIIILLTAIGIAMIAFLGIRKDIM
jgi:hypothetical protein